MKGFASVHPSTEQRLRSCAIFDADVTQGIGSAALSAGTHLKVGTYKGRAFGHCIDLAWESVTTREQFDHLVAADFDPFRRDWAGNQHWHVVDRSGLVADGGKTPAPRPLVRVQLEDFSRGLNGLVGHAPIEKPWCPDFAQRGDAAADLTLGGACAAVIVGVGTRQVDCHAYLERGSVRCEFRPLVEAMGGVVRWVPHDAGARLTVMHNASVWTVDTDTGCAGQQKDLIPFEWRARVEGDFVRCALRTVAKALGHTVEWDEKTLRVKIGKES